MMGCPCLQIVMGRDALSDVSTAGGGLFGDWVLCSVWRKRVIDWCGRGGGT